MKGGVIDEQALHVDIHDMELGSQGQALWLGSVWRLLRQETAPFRRAEEAALPGFRGVT